MERNDIQKISSETANIPVYKQSAEYAIEHDELPAYRESFRVNMACRDALESAIHESYHDYCLDTGKAAAQVAAQFGMERVAYVLANTVRAFDHDGRISRDNKAWAQTVPVCTDADEWGHERSRYFLVSQFILKSLLAPVMLILAFLIWLCTLTLHISSVLLNILSVLLVLVSVFSFIDHNVKNGVIELVAAFLLSPYGLPMLGAWLVAQLHLLRYWMKEKVYW